MVNNHDDFAFTLNSLNKQRLIEMYNIHDFGKTGTGMLYDSKVEK